MEAILAINIAVMLEAFENNYFENGILVNPSARNLRGKPLVAGTEARRNVLVPNMVTPKGAKDSPIENRLPKLFHINIHNSKIASSRETTFVLSLHLITYDVFHFLPTSLIPLAQVGLLVLWLLFS
jgi:hypothetical protein